ncbi:MAG: acyl-CoA synthetase [Spirochaetaceae bacterium]|nr:MAG: acyl-CoA synthetase [Spirochaetaceae bacterium]
MANWRLFFNPSGDAADIVSYGAALAEGRIVGKYQLSGGSLSDTLVIQGVKQKSIVAGADVKVDKEKSTKENIDVAYASRQGRRGAKPVGSINLSELMSKASATFEAVDRDLDDPAVLIYTSGTTGKPKGVMLSHRNFYSQCADVSTSVFPLGVSDTVVLVLPLYHVYGLSNGLLLGIFNGTRLALVPQYSPQALYDAIESTDATALIAVPAMYTQLVTLAKRKKAQMPKSLRICVSGGAPLPHRVLEDFEKEFNTRIAEGYGLTETTSAVCLNEFGENFKLGSIGPPAPGVEMTVFDDQNNPVPTGQEGEIVIKGDVVTKGYWKLPEETASTIIDGWLHTGDLGYVDEDGFFFITDRKKDLIIRGGYNISPREVEEVVYTHPKVSEAAVIGVPDKRGEEAVKTFVVLRDGETATEREIVEFCEAHLSSYKVPKYVEFIEQLPKSPTGKVLRKELRGESGESDRMITEN